MASTMGLTGGARFRKFEGTNPESIRGVRWFIGTASSCHVFHWRLGWGLRTSALSGL